MNAPHLHLLVNHAPVFASVFAALILLWALARRSADVKRLALASVVVLGLSTPLAYYTGEPAEHAIGHESGVERKRIHEHEEAAEWALIGASIAGLVALASLVVFRRREPPMAAILIVLLLDLWTVAIFARVADLGGEIRHPEIRAGWTQAPRPAGEKPPPREP